MKSVNPLPPEVPLPGAVGPRPRVSNRRGPRVGLLFAVVLGAGVLAAVVLSSLTSGGQPHYQQRVKTPQMEHMVNLWLDPMPPTTGSVNLMAQVTDVSAWPSPPQTLSFRIVRLGQDVGETVTGAYYQDGPGRGSVFRAESRFDGQGPWEVIVQFQMLAGTAIARFPVSRGR